MTAVTLIQICFFWAILGLLIAPWDFCEAMKNRKIFLLHSALSGPFFVAIVFFLALVFSASKLISKITGIDYSQNQFFFF